ncbi:hypothetical protein C1878_15925 [Gordonibacter sp. 28C]|nr:hypothetical protein C1878_15925 [Gordonibacter sp. 28C]
MFFFCFKMFIFHQDGHYAVLPVQSLGESIGFFIYSLAVNLEYMLISVFVIPLLICIWAYGSMSKKDRALFWICALWGLVTVFVITYTISIREDVGLDAIRQHTRYYSALVVPLIILLIKYFNKEKSIFGNHKKPQLVAMAVTVIFILGTMLLSQVYYGSLVDNFNLRYFNWMIEAIEQSTFFDAVIIMRIIVIAAVVLIFSCIAFTRFKRIGIGLFLFCVLTVCLIGNAVCIKLFDATYSVSDQGKNEVLELGDYLSKKDGNLLIVLDSNPTYSLCNKKLDTFLNVDNEYQIYLDTLFDIIKDDGTINLNDENVSTRSFNLARIVPYENLDAISYILVNVNQGVSIPPSSGKLVEDFTYGDYRLYNLSDTNNINIMISLSESDFSMRVG